MSNELDLRIAAIKGFFGFLSVAAIAIACALIFSSCTPRNNLAHQYHVASITINGEVTETDFLLTNGE